jgi:ferritin
MRGGEEVLTSSADQFKEQFDKIKKGLTNEHIAIADPVLTEFLDKIRQGSNSLKDALEKFKLLKNWCLDPSVSLRGRVLNIDSGEEPAIAAHFGAEALPELAGHFRKQAEEEKEHALRFIQFLLDAGARVEIPGVLAPQASFAAAEEAVKLSLEQEERGTAQINTLVSTAKAESDYTSDNFLQWFVKEQLEEVSSMDRLLRVVQRAGEANLLRVEDYLSREKGHGTGSVTEEVTEAG